MRIALALLVMAVATISASPYIDGEPGAKATQQPVALGPALPPPPPAPMPAILRTYTAVTADRLKHPQPGDWLMVRRTYDGWGYSPLEDITPANVARLQPAWVVS